MPAKPLTRGALLVLVLIGTCLVTQAEAQWWRWGRPLSVPVAQPVTPGPGGSCNEAFTAPIGIPCPPFGTSEVHTMYTGQMYAYGTGTAAYKSTANGPYTHYIDANSGSCTNSSNNYGTVATPRCAMPSATFVTAGAVIEVHAVSTTGQISQIYVGTVAAPIFVRGANTMTKGTFMTSSFLVRGQYVIYEYLDFVTGGPDIRSVAESVHHVVLRHSYLHTGAHTGVTGVSQTFITSQVLIWDNQIYTDNFDPNGGEFPENDVVGVGMAKNTEDVWVVDNDIRGQSGDAVGAGHAANYTAKRWYIGRNLMHGTGENGIDLKEVDGVVVSQNTIYHFAGLSSGSTGTAVVVHYGPNVSAKHVWFLFNDISDAVDQGIQVGGAQLFETYFIGNIIHDIHNAGSTAVAFVTFQSCRINLVSNVWYNNDNVINASGSAACGHLIFKNNIVSVAAGYYINNLTDSGYEAAIEFTKNLFYPTGPLTDGTCAGCLTSNPLFTNPGAGNFTLQAMSPAIDAGDATIMTTLADEFFAYFGVNVYTDFAGVTRPVGAGWDLGVYDR